MRGLLRYLFMLGGTLAAVWLAGLLLFVAVIAHYSEPAINDALEPTEAIVVLTGGSERLTSGLELLAAGKGKKLLVSGVHHGLSMDSVLGNKPIARELRDCCITLGHTADNTIGNAEETRGWMQRQNFQSLRLVTAQYHMPRSLLLFRKAMPNLTIVPYPVTPGSVKLENWWERSGTASLLVTEYNKYLVALAVDFAGERL